MNLPIFRNFLEFFWIYLNLFLIFKRIKINFKIFFLISRADVAEHCHVVTRVHITWRRMCITRVRVCARIRLCAHVCERVCARVRVRVINGLKHPKRINSNPLNSYFLYMWINIKIYSVWDYLCLFFSYKWHGATRDVWYGGWIAIVGCHLLARVRGDIWLGEDSI